MKQEQDNIRPRLTGSPSFREGGFNALPGSGKTRDVLRRNLLDHSKGRFARDKVPLRPVESSSKFLATDARSMNFSASTLRTSSSALIQRAAKCKNPVQQMVTQAKTQMKYLLLKIWRRLPQITRDYEIFGANDELVELHSKCNTEIPPKAQRTSESWLPLKSCRGHAPLCECQLSHR